MEPQTTFVFRDDTVYALREGKVVASDGDLEALEQKLAYDETGHEGDMGGGLATEMPPAPQDLVAPCPQCGSPTDEGDQFCAQCGAPLAGGEEPVGPPPMDQEPALMGSDGPGQMPFQASITTPNGLKGTVLGKTASVWGDEVTIRFENGVIRTLPVVKGMKVASAEKTQEKPIDGLRVVLAASADGTLDGLEERRDALLEAQHTASGLIREGVSDADARVLDEIIVTAEAEVSEVDDAISHLHDEETQAYAPPAPFSMGVAHDAAASLGGRDASWLDHTANELIAEAEATDFKQLMDEGPEALAAELEDAALADSGVVRQMAASFIRSKTAGTDLRVRDPYESTFLSRVEECRRAELVTRKQTTKKEAAAEEDQYTDAPDDAIFL